MDMDISSWLHGYAATTNAGGYAPASSPADLQNKDDDQHQFLISSQIQHHLNQISMRMNMDDEASVYVPIVEGLFDDTCSFPSSSSTASAISLPAGSASFPCSPDPESSSAHILGAPATVAGGSNLQYPEVSSNMPLLPPTLTTMVLSYKHQYTPMSPTMTSAFKHYGRHLSPRSPPKPGTSGQKMFKTAMSLLSKMHVAARYNYNYQAAGAAETAQAQGQPPSVNQLHHMFSERKRREKLNDSFHALRAVLPPGAKKDKTSLLIRAREYVMSLEAKVAELEKKNKTLESRLTRRDSHRKDGGRAGRPATAGAKNASGGAVLTMQI